MKVVTEINVAAQTAELPEPRGILNNLHVEPVVGCHVQIKLGSAGLFIRRGDYAVAFPIEALLRSVLAVEPGLLNPSSPSTQIAQLAAQEANQR